MIQLIQPNKVANEGRAGEPDGIILRLSLSLSYGVEHMSLTYSMSTGCGWIPSPATPANNRALLGSVSAAQCFL